MRYEVKDGGGNYMAAIYKNIVAKRLAAFGGIKQELSPQATPGTHIYSLISHLYSR